MALLREKIKKYKVT